MIMPSRDVANFTRLHAMCFDAMCFNTMCFGGAWSATAFEDLLAVSGVQAFATDDGFILLQAVADETEILTLAVAPAARRRGLAHKLIDYAQRALQARIMMLEVATDNRPALALYEKCGFRPCGTRPAYYKRAVGSRVDAVLMRRDFSASLC